MYFITIKRMLEVCFSAHPNIQYRAKNETGGNSMAYEYGHDCPFEAYITNLGKYNEGELVGEWVKFPTTSEDLKKVFERIGIGSKDDFGNPYEEWFISDYDCYVDGLYEMLGEYESLDELNYLAFFKKKSVIFFYEK